MMVTQNRRQYDGAFRSRSEGKDPMPLKDDSSGFRMKREDTYVPNPLVAHYLLNFNEGLTDHGELPKSPLTSHSGPSSSYNSDFELGRNPRDNSVVSSCSSILSCA